MLNIFTTEWLSTAPFKQIAMYETTLNPDFNRLKTFFPHITDADIERLQQAGDVPVILEYMREACTPDTIINNKFVKNISL